MFTLFHFKFLSPSRPFRLPLFSLFVHCLFPLLFTCWCSASQRTQSPSFSCWYLLSHVRSFFLECFIPTNAMLLPCGRVVSFLQAFFIARLDPFATTSFHAELTTDCLLLLCCAIALRPFESRHAFHSGTLSSRPT